MHRAKFATLILAAALVATSASAYTFGPWGCNLRWDHCYGDGGVQNRNFACDTNSGSETLVGSFVPAWDIANVSGLEIVMDLASASTSLPAWWELKNAGTCRQLSLGMNLVPVAPTVTACPDWGQGNTAGGIGAYRIGSRGPNSVRMVAAVAVPQSVLQFLSAGHEYFGFNLTINHAKTVGIGNCAGCTTPVCMVFNSVMMTTPTQSLNRWLTGPANQTDSNFTTWQGGGVPVGPNGSAPGCPSATPTLRQTWGALKSLYR
jgi:hypothetical protein